MAGLLNEETDDPLDVPFAPAEAALAEDALLLAPLNEPPLVDAAVKFPELDFAAVALIAPLSVEALVDVLVLFDPLELAVLFVLVELWLELSFAPNVLLPLSLSIELLVEEPVSDEVELLVALWFKAPTRLNEDVPLLVSVDDTVESFDVFFPREYPVSVELEGSACVMLFAWFTAAAGVVVAVVVRAPS